MENVKQLLSLSANTSTRVKQLTGEKTVKNLCINSSHWRLEGRSSKRACLETVDSTENGKAAVLVGDDGVEGLGMGDKANITPW